MHSTDAQPELRFIKDRIRSYVRVSGEKVYTLSEIPFVAKAFFTLIVVLLPVISSFCQATTVEQSTNVHAGLINTKFRLLDQPFYCRLFDVLTPRDVVSDEMNSNGLIIAFWSSDNQESIDEYKKLLDMLSDLEKSHILLIGVSFDECRETWQQTIEKESLHNRWNCLYDQQMLKTQHKDSALLLHYRQTSLPFSISVRNGIIVGASRAVRFEVMR
ncbi:hypothetical protein WBG78_07555 [Chryseolinea sp. T2]|uniref:hypothetical protein n=1 Tax=Chryseolinea sp. T2 TaxID=3129255 RepID=UPI0030774BBB